MKKVYDDLMSDLNLKAGSVPLLAGEVVNADHQGEKAAFNEILVAENNPNDVELTLEALARNHLGGAVAVARDGAEAMDYLYARGRFASRVEGNPAVILLDLMMSKLDGFEVLRQVKADAGLKHIPILVLTSSSLERDMVEKYSEEANGFAVKAVDFQEFVGAVRELGLF
jgi:CheY-like chemotaxis protein